jgi:hypothetical protein
MPINRKVRFLLFHPQSFKLLDFLGIGFILYAQRMQYYFGFRFNSFSTVLIKQLSNNCLWLWLLIIPGHYTGPKIFVLYRFYKISFIGAFLRTFIQAFSPIDYLLAIGNLKMRKFFVNWMTFDRVKTLSLLPRLKLNHFQRTRNLFCLTDILTIFEADDSGLNDCLFPSPKLPYFSPIYLGTV